ncbi:MAG: hypothetical protein VCG02_02590, partial [Verrucomicrobiota bacterium]
MTEEMHHQKLKAQLGAMEERLKKIQFWRASGNTVVLFLLALGLAALIDYFIPLAFSQRLVLTIAVYGSVAAYAIYGWWLPYRRPMKAEKIAWVLEELEPQFNEKLISAVEFSGTKTRAISLDMIDSVLDDAEIDLARHDPEKVFPLTSRTFTFPVLIALIFLGLFLVPGFQFNRLVSRVAFPLDHQATVGTFRLIVHAPTGKKAAEADTLAFEVECTDGSIEEVDLVIEDKKMRRFAMAFDETRKRYVFSHPDIRQSFRFWAQSGRVQSRKHELTVIPRPKVRDFTIGYTFPSYTGMPASTTTQPTGALKGYPGTQVTLKIQATKPLKALTLVELGEERDLAIDGTDTAAIAHLTIEKSGEYSLTLLDTDGLENLNAIVFPIVAMEDQAPTVKILKPGGEVHLGLEDSLPLHWEAIDDFGIAQQELIWTVPGREPGSIRLDPDASTHEWSLREAGLQTGDELSYRLRVEDAVGQVAESHTRYLSLLKDLALADSTSFRNIARTLSGELNGMAKRLETLEGLEVKLNSRGGAAAEDLSHNRNLIIKHAQWLSDRLAESEKLSRDLLQKSFFPRGKIASELMARHFRQERLFSTVRLTREDAVQAIASIDEMRNLNQQMTQALLEKANQHVPAIQARRMARTARSLEVDSGREILDRLAERARKISAKHHPKSSDAFKNSDRLVDKLTSLQNELDRKAGDYAQIDRLIKEIRGRLKSREDQMAALARQLELYNREQDWESVEEMRNALNQAAMQETENLARQADLELAAKVLDKAIEAEDPDRVEEVVDRLPGMDRQHELEALRNEIADTREEASEVLATLREDLVDGESTDIPEDLEALAHQLDQLKETPLAGESLHEDAEGKKIYAPLNAADQHLEQLERALSAGDTAKAQREMAQLENRIQQAEQEADQTAQRGEDALAQDRGALENLQESLSEQLSEVAQMLRSDAPEGAPEPRQLQAASSQLDELAGELQREAQREIARPDGNAKEARNKLAMAETLEQLNEQRLQPATQALQAAQQADEVDLARGELQEALAELAKSQMLAERAEQSENLELPLQAREEVEEQLDKLAEETLPDDLIESLETLEHLRESGEDVEEMADAIEDKTSQPKTVGEAVDELRQDLGHALMIDGKEAFMDEAEDVIATAQRGTEELLTDARALRAEMRNAERTPQQQAMIQAEAEALTEQARELGVDLARADAVRDLLQPDAETALDPLIEAIPQLEQVARKTDEAGRALEQAMAAPAEGQPPMTPEQLAAKEQQAERALEQAGAAMERAIEGAKEAAASLEQFAEAFPGMEPQPQRVAALQGEEAMNASQLEPAAEHLDRMQDLMTETRALQASAKKMKDDLLPEIAEAARLLEQLPEAGLEKWQEQAMDRAREAFAKMENPQAMATGLEQAASALKQEERALAKELRREAQEMKKLAQHGFQPLQELERRAGTRMQEMKQEASRLAADLAKMEAPEADSAQETLEQFQQNVANEDLARAEKNLDAIEADLQALAQADPAVAEQPVTMPVPAPRSRETPELNPERLLAQHPELQQAANRETPWHERKGLMEAAAEALNHAQAQLPEAKLAVQGELQKAAETAPLQAANHFTKAAELQEALEDAQPMSKDFKQDPAAFIEQAREQVAKAQAAAEKVARAVDDGQRPGESEMEKLQETIEATENLRGQMGEAQHPAQDALEEDVAGHLEGERPNFLEAGEGMQDVEEALAAYADELEKTAEDQAAFEQIAALSDQLKQLSQEEKKAEAAQAAKQLAAVLKEQEGAKAAEALAAVQNREPEQAAELVEALNPAADIQADTPDAFSQPREMLDPQEEQALAEQAAEDRGAFIEGAQEQLTDTRAAAEKVQKKLEKGKLASEEDMAALEAAVNELEAMRDKLGARDFEAHRALEDRVLSELESDTAKAGDAAEGMHELKDRLATYGQLLQAEMERQKGFDEIEELAAALEEAADEHESKPEGARAAAAKLGASLEKRKGLASMEATEALEALEEALEEAASPKQRGELTTAMEALKDKVEELNPAEEPQVAPNREAFDAAAKAAALENQEALQDAIAGDYEAAAESMKELAEALPESGRKEQAEKSAKEFRAAREEQMEELQDDLAEALEGAEALEEQLPVAAAEALKDATDATRAGELPAASERLQDAIAAAKGEDREALARLDEEIKEAFKQEEAAIAALSEEAQTALDAVGELSRKADPVTQSVLEEATESLKQEEFGKAAEKLAEAAFGLPEEGFNEAAALARELQKEEQEKYGEASEAAREGLKGLGNQHPQIAEAAKAEDYKTAADMAKKEGEKEAAQAFEEAAANQKAALPSYAQEGLNQLEDAIKRASGEELDRLKEAETAALKGAFEEAADLAAEVAHAHADEAALAEALEAAKQYQDEVVKPLEDAVQDANQHKMEQAAQHAAQSPKGQEAAESLQAVEYQAEAAAKKAFEEAFGSPQERGRQQLEKAAHSALNNQLDQAIQEAKQAGKTGRETQAALEQAKQARDQARQATQQALNDARENSPAQQAAEQAMQQAQSAQQEAAKAAQAAGQQAQQDQQALNQAQAALNQNKPEQAAQAAAKAEGAQAELAQQLNDLEPDAGNEARQAAQEALNQAKQVAQQQGQQAQLDQRAAQQAEQGLKQAEQAMQQGRLDQAAEIAKSQAQGAFEAQKASEAFAKAAEAQPPQAPSPAGQMAQSQPSQGEPSESAQSQPSQGEPSQGQPSESAQSQPSQGEPSQGQPSQGQPSQGQPSESAQGQPSQGQPSESAQGQPSQGQPSESAQGQPSQGQPSESA